MEFKDAGTKDIADGTASKAARRVLPVNLHDIAFRKLGLLRVATSINDLRVPKSNHLEILLGDRKGQHSIRINYEYRICFVWTASGPVDVEIVNYHS